MRAALALLACLGTAACGLTTERPAPTAASWRPWVLPSPGAIDVPPPPAPGSAAARQDVAQRERTVRRRTPAQAATAQRQARLLAVEPWLQGALERVSLGSTKDPPSASRAYGLVSVAMFDALVAAVHHQERYGRPAPDGHGFSYPADRAAVAGAAARMLGHLFPEFPAARWELLAQRQSRLRIAAGTSFPSDEREGLRLGRRVADAVIARARGDGRDTLRWDGRRPRGPTHWEPPPGSLTRPVQPMAGAWRTWVLESPSELRPPPPPAYGTPRFEAEALRVIEVDRRLTADQRRIAEFWAAGQGTSLPAGFWNEVALGYARRAGLDRAHTVRAFALLNVALADAGVAAWDAKYAYWSPRPVNAIRELGLDRRFTPLLPTPSFPSYVSGHSTYSAAAAEILAYLFPDVASYVRARAREAGASRIYGGIHFPADNEAGLALGRAVGARVIERARRDEATR